MRMFFFGQVHSERAHSAHGCISDQPKKKKQGELGQRYHSAMTVLGLDVDESPACFGTNDTDASLRSTDGGFALVKLAAVAQACEFFFFFF